jgi:hypothetical protein
MTLAATSFDGYFYLIDGQTTCADVIDIGETSYSRFLADNVDGGDDLDLIMTTMNGNVFCFSTPAPHHPLKTWTFTEYRWKLNQCSQVVEDFSHRSGINLIHTFRQVHLIKDTSGTIGRGLVSYHQISCRISGISQ